MFDVEGSVFARVPCIASDSIKKFFEGISDCAVVLSEHQDGCVAFSSFNPKEAVETARLKPTGSQDVSVVSSGTFTLSEQDCLAIEDLGATIDGSAGWIGYSFEMADGSRDRLALALSREDEAKLSDAFFERVWPLLRKECFRDIARESGLGAPDWSLLDALDVAILVLDAKGLMFRQNSAARDMLREGTVIKRGHGGIFAADDVESREFREAISATVDEAIETENPDGGRVVFLSDVKTSTRIPVTLSPYVHDGKVTTYVVARVPAPPNAARVEALARQLGLTPAESRVASLIQLGHTNREAAGITGLKEQTFNTYAKRVMSKLGVRGRTELAQMLTWQCNGGLSS